MEKGKENKAIITNLHYIDVRLLANPWTGIFNCLGGKNRGSNTKEVVELAW
jgi:hypothetical protein